MTFDSGRALIIGVGTYTTVGWDAPVTVGDATGVAEALRDAAVAGYAPERVQLLHDGDATLTNIIAALDGLAAASGPGDTVVVFYAGHGLLDAGGEYNLTAHDTAFQGRDHVVPGTGLSESVLLDRLRKIEAQKLLIILNACFSGNIGTALGAGEEGQGDAEVARGAPVSENLSTRVLATGEGRAVLTACKASQESWFLRGGSMTFFGQAVADALRGKGRIPGAEYIGLWDFYGYVFEATRTAAAALPGKPLQQPVMNISQLVGAFPIAVSGAPPGTALGGPASIAAGPPVGTAANVVDPIVVEAARGYVPGASIDGRSYRAEFQVVDRSKVIDLGGATIIGNVDIANVAAGDLTQITIAATPTAAATVSSSDDLTSAIQDVRRDVGALVGVDDERTDITRELDDAERAVADGRTDRVLIKLDRAREQLQALGPSIPAAVPLSETVSVLLQRARSVGH